MNILQYNYNFQNIKFIIYLQPYLLHLRTAFGTNHSLTTERINALIKINIQKNDQFLNEWGFGEIGLPPKKPLCYTADFEDVKYYFIEFNKKLQISLIDGLILQYYDPFQEVPLEYFVKLRNIEESSLLLLIRVIFSVLDDKKLSFNSFPFSLTCKSGIESALFDIWGKLIKKPLYEMIGINWTSKRGFYTASLNDDLSVMINSALFGRQYTPYLKIKLDSNTKKGFEILQNLYNKFKNFDLSKKWSIDANSAWTPEICFQYLEFLNQFPFKDCLYMIEQPFPCELGKLNNFSSDELKKWIEIKNSYEKIGILIYADESISTEEDLDKLSLYCHGINIKLEKAGGIRNCLKIIDKAKKLNLKIWIGSMVSSVLNCNTACHILSFADFGGDLDGSLLIDEKSQLFEGGFTWNNQNGFIYISKNYGIGVNSKEFL